MNVAKRKPAFQSSIRKDAGASRAVDGWALSDITLDSCARTLVETDPWWLVNLETVYLVTSVQLQDAAACCRESALLRDGRGKSEASLTDGIRDGIGFIFGEWMISIGKDKNTNTDKHINTIFGMISFYHN